MSSFDVWLSDLDLPKEASSDGTRQSGIQQSQTGLTIGIYRGRMETLHCLSLYLPNARYPESLQLDFRRSLWLTVGVFEVAIVGVDDNHAGKKDQGRIYCTATVVQLDTHLVLRRQQLHLWLWLMLRGYSQRE